MHVPRRQPVDLRKSGAYVAIPRSANDSHTQEGGQEAEQGALPPFQPVLFDHLLESQRQIPPATA
jgi:hypothetical protein